MKSQTECPLCHSSRLQIHHVLKIQDRYKIPEKRLSRSNNYARNYILFEYILKRKVAEFAVCFVICKSCGFIFFSPRPEVRDLGIKYDLIHQQKDTLARERKSRLVDQRGLRSQEIRNLLERYWCKQTGRALDVGGADGHCLGAMTRDFDCCILDFENRDLWPSVKKIGDSLNDLSPSDEFDVVMTNHTLEHVVDIRDFIQSITSRLREKGILYIEVPYGCAGEVFRTRNLLTHINFFSEGSLGYLVEQEGLSIARMTSGPVLSSKRYLPVITTIARKESSKQNTAFYKTKAFAITRNQMKVNLNKEVLLANFRLVMSSPLQYGFAFIRRIVELRKVLP